jgi:hypothetical protein
MMRALFKPPDRPMTTLPHPFSKALLAGVLACALVPALHAADKPKESGFGKGKATGAMLTREQLRACLAQQSRVAHQDGEMVAEQAALNTAKAEILRSGAELKEQLAVLDRTSPDAVSAYNERAAARDKSLDDYQARVPAFNSRVEAVKAEREAFGKACDNRRYFEDDEIAIRKGK